MQGPTTNGSCSENILHQNKTYKKDKAPGMGGDGQTDRQTDTTEL